MNSSKLIIGLTTAILLATSSLCFAVPAYRGEITVTQKDGTTITIKKFGDEFFNYTTTIDGYLISQKDGVYYYSDIAFNGNRIVSTTKANNPSRRSAQERKMLGMKSITKNNPVLSSIAIKKRNSKATDEPIIPFPTLGEIKSLVILVNFKDVKFSSSSANADFNNMLNSPNYRANGGTGSAKDYFLDNSLDKFTPHFDVYGPIELPNNMAYYGGNGADGQDLNPQEMVLDACLLATNIDFSQYDVNNDGYIDNVFVYFAGYNEAESSDEDTIWPHKWSVHSRPSINGKTLYTYTCSSEFKGNEGGTIAGIGTFTHEFGHVLGLADTYDTSGNVDGRSFGMFEYDIMDQGTYNNNGNTPPYYMAYQRYQLGWMEPTELSENRKYTLANISKNKAFLIQAYTEGEYFLLEYRNASDNSHEHGRNWDKYIGSTYNFSPNGLLISHIDKSDNYVDGIKAKSRWKYNIVNNVLSHECARIVYANGDRIPSSSNLSSMLFPGSENVTSFSYDTPPAAIDWKGNSLFVDITDIKLENNVVTFTNMIEYSVNPSTNAFLLHFFEGDNSWNVKWRKHGTSDYEEVLDYSALDLIISGLESDTEYDLIIELAKNGSDQYSSIFNSVAETNMLDNDYTTILYDYEQSKTNATFSPALFNYEGEDNRVTWFLNNKETKINYSTILPSGDYDIICEIDRWGRKDRIYKSFIVR